MVNTLSDSETVRATELYRTLKKHMNEATGGQWGKEHSLLQFLETFVPDNTHVMVSEDNETGEVEVKIRGRSYGEVNSEPINVNVSGALIQRGVSRRKRVMYLQLEGPLPPEESPEDQSRDVEVDD